MNCVVEIPAGDYEIGDNGIPNAGPRHHRRLTQAIWIDAQPVGWGDFVEFVIEGGYSRPNLWPHLPEGTALESVDLRCRLILQQSETCWRSMARDKIGSMQSPITGLSWFEAFAVARCFGARLPFETEWEIAMRDVDSSDKQKKRCEVGPWRSHFLNDRGCVDTVGTVQEWTADAFQPRYWRADSDAQGAPSIHESPTTARSVRGAAQGDLHRHVSRRVGKAPHEVNEFRGFRRVWDRRPTDRQLIGS